MARKRLSRKSPIEDLPLPEALFRLLSQTASNACVDPEWRRSLRTIGDLCSFGRRRLLELQHIGEKKVSEIERVLAAFGFELDEPAPRRPAQARASRSSLGAALTHAPVAAAVVRRGARSHAERRVALDAFDTTGRVVWSEGNSPRGRGPPPPRMPRQGVADELAEGLRRTKAAYVSIRLGGELVAAFLCPFCGDLAGAQPTVPNVAFHHRQGCKGYHELGPIAFIAKAESLGLLPCVRPTRCAPG